MRRVLIPNRGEIAVRIIRACFDEGLESVVALSEADMDTLPARLADKAVCIGPPSPSESYLSVPRVIAAALGTECDALHPGYGFLSERTELVEACVENEITFVGPGVDAMRQAGDKMVARSIARRLGTPVGSGTEEISSADEIPDSVAELGFPLMIKAAAGGGGRGMALVTNESELRERVRAASHEALQAFGDGRVYLERFVERARHVEVQVLGDTHGNVCHLGERDCSCQRRYQKLVEESPAPGLPTTLLEEMRSGAVAIARDLAYAGAATAEFLVDVDRENFVFLEVNARVQVEHPVTEMTTGIDIVREQLRIADGKPLSFRQKDVVLSGHAIECRINAEDAHDNFRPAPGTLARWVPPLGSSVRVDSHCFPGAIVPPFYDSLLAKLIVHANDRQEAVALMERALERFQVEGVPTTIGFHQALMASPEFSSGPVSTRWLEETFLPTQLLGANHG